MDPWPGWVFQNESERPESYLYSCWLQGSPGLPELWSDTCDQVLGPELASGARAEPTVVGGYAWLRS